MLSSVLDTMVKGCEVDPTLFFDDKSDEDTNDSSTNTSANTTDGANETATEKTSLYRLISESDVEVSRTIIDESHTIRPMHQRTLGVGFLKFSLTLGAHA